MLVIKQKENLPSSLKLDICYPRCLSKCKVGALSRIDQYPVSVKTRAPRTRPTLQLDPLPVAPAAL